MKTLFLTAFLAITIVSCNNKAKETETNSTENKESSNELFACPMHPEVTGKKGEKCSKCSMELTEPVAQSKPDKNTQEPSLNNSKAKVGVLGADTSVTPLDYVNDIVICYLNLKNKLVKDDSEGAAEKGKILLASFNRLDTKTLNANQKKAYIDIAEDAKEQAEHIAENAGKLDHQREHFILLSKDINDLIKMFGSKMQLYQDYCPMADDGKGAIWISETKEIKNPFYGSKMLTCGSLKKTL
jgi:hypothetical protein